MHTYTYIYVYIYIHIMYLFVYIFSSTVCSLYICIYIERERVLLAQVARLDSGGVGEGPVQMCKPRLRA